MILESVKFVRYLKNLCAQVTSVSTVPSHGSGSKTATWCRSTPHLPTDFQLTFYFAKTRYSCDISYRNSRLMSLSETCVLAQEDHLILTSMVTLSAVLWFDLKLEHGICTYNI